MHPSTEARCKRLKFWTPVVLTLLAASAAWSDSFTVVSNQTGQNANDSVQWGQLGADGTTLGSTFNVQSAAGASVGVTLAGPNSVVSVVCPASPCSWTGSGFTAGDPLLWASDAANGGNGPVTLTFAKSVAGAGAMIQADAPGQFTAQLQVFNGTTSLGSFTVQSDANGDAAYIGVLDQSGANITSLVFSLANCVGVCGDFALDTVLLNIAAPVVNLSPTSLTFAGQLVNTTSTAQSVTLKNTGSGTLTVNSVATSGDYAATNGCGGSVSPGVSCSISVTFTPKATGTRTGTLTISDNAAGSPQSISLSGTGTAPAVTLAPTSLTFASQTVGTTSPAKSVTLKNSGNATLSITSIATSGDYAQTNGCGSSVAAGVSCTINVTFHPTATGTRTGTLTISDNAAGSPQSVALTGTGASSSPAVTLTPTSLTFASQTVGTTSPAKSVTLKNSGNATLSITSIATSGDYAQTNGCGSSVAAGVSCTINVTFHPTATGTRTGTLTISDNAAGSPQSVPLTGTGANGSPTVNLSPTSLTFEAVTVGQTSSPLTVTLTNTGTASLNITGISLGGADPPDFGETNNCGSSVAAGKNCTLTVTSHPKAIGNRTAAIFISDNASGSPQSINLTGGGTDVKLSSLSLIFPTVTVGQTSPAQTVTLTNVGSTSFIMGGVTLVGTNPTDFSVTNNCGSSVKAGGSCTLTVTFHPKATGSRVAYVSVDDTGGESPQKIRLTGTGK